MSNIKEVHGKPRLPVSVNLLLEYGRHVARLRRRRRVRTRPQAMPLAMITMRKSSHGFPLLPYTIMGLRLAVFRAAGAPLKIK